MVSFGSGARTLSRSGLHLSPQGPAPPGTRGCLVYRVYIQQFSSRRKREVVADTIRYVRFIHLTTHDSRAPSLVPRPLRLYPVYTYMPLLPPLTNLPDAFDCAAVRAERMHDAVLIRSVYKEFGKYVRGSEGRKEGTRKEPRCMLLYLQQRTLLSC